MEEQYFYIATTQDQFYETASSRHQEKLNNYIRTGKFITNAALASFVAPNRPPDYRVKVESQSVSVLEVNGMFRIVSSLLCCEIKEGADETIPVMPHPTMPKIS